MLKRLTEPPEAYAALLIAAALLAVAFPDCHAAVALTLAIVLGPMAIVFCHELGHGLAGLACGYRFYYLVVGPLQVERIDGRLRLLANRSWAQAGGLCATLPEPNMPLEGLRRSHQIVLLAGPVAGCAAGAALWLVGHDSPILVVIAAMAFGSSFASLLPLRSDVYVTDGLGIRILRAGGPRADELLHGLLLSPILTRPVPPALWPAEHVAAIERTLADQPPTPADAEWPRFLAWQQLLYHHYADLGDIAHAGELLKSVAEPFTPRQLRSNSLQSAAALRAFHLARYCHDAPYARRLLAPLAKVKLYAPLEYKRSLAAVLLAEGDRAGAAQTLGEARKLVTRQLPTTGMGAMELHWLAEMEKEALDNGHSGQ